MSALAGAAARLLYYLVVTPAGLVSRLFADPLGTRRAPAESNWRALPPDDPSLESARSRS